MAKNKPNVTIMTLDIRGFTPLCEKLKLDRTGRLIDEYISIVRNALGKVAQKENEIKIDRFLGDGFLIFFFDTDDACFKALEASIDIKNTFTKKISSEYNFTNAGIGIAVGKGEVLYRNFGQECSKDSLVCPENWQGELTGIGTPINKTFRMLSIASKNQILISDEVKKEISDDYIWTELDSINVKGIREPIIPFQILRKGKWAEERYCSSCKFCKYTEFCKTNYSFGQSHRILLENIKEKWELTDRHLCDQRQDGIGYFCKGCEINRVTGTNSTHEGCNRNYEKGRKGKLDDRFCCGDCAIYAICQFNLHRGKNHRPSRESELKRKTYCCELCQYFNTPEEDCVEKRMDKSL